MSELSHLDAEGKVGLDLTWIAQGGLVYQIAGVAPVKRFEELRPVLRAVVQSFRPLTAAERAGVKEKRIRLVKARAAETIATLVARTNSAWTENELP